jgi:hypothetical protein
MLTDSLPTNAWLSCEMRPSRLQRAVISTLSGRRAPDTANAPIAIRLVTRIIMSRPPTGGSNDVRDTSLVDY